jgi:hypothetical protein
LVIGIKSLGYLSAKRFSTKRPETFSNQLVVLGVRDLEVRNGGTAVDVDGLHPHSIYRIEVRAIMPGVAKPELVSTLAETKPSLPEVAPVASAVKNSVRCPCYETFFSSSKRSSKLKQGTLTEGEGSVRSTSSLG